MALMVAEEADEAARDDAEMEADMDECEASARDLWTRSTTPPPSPQHLKRSAVAAEMGGGASGGRSPAVPGGPSARIKTRTVAGESSLSDSEPSSGMELALLPLPQPGCTTLGELPGRILVPETPDQPPALKEHTLSSCAQPSFIPESQPEPVSNDDVAPAAAASGSVPLQEPAATTSAGASCHHHGTVCRKISKAF
jgi:hypothetical protein